MGSALSSGTKTRFTKQQEGRYRPVVISMPKQTAAQTPATTQAESAAIFAKYGLTSTGQKANTAATQNTARAAAAITANQQEGRYRPVVISAPKQAETKTVTPVSAPKSEQRVGNYNAQSLLNLGKGPISAATANKLVENGQASAHAKNGQIYLTPSTPKTSTVSTAAAPMLATQKALPALTQPTSAAVQSKDKNRFGDYATDALFQMAKLNPTIGNLLTIDNYTGNTLKNMSSSMIGDAASNAVNLGGTALDTVGTVASKTAAPLSRTAQNMYALSDRLNQESRDSLNDALTGKGKLGQAIVNADVKLGKYGAQAAANLAVPGLGTGLRIIDEAGRSTREYRQSSGENYDPVKAATRGAASAIGVAAGNAVAKGVSDHFPEAPYTSALQDILRNQALRGGASAGAYAVVDTASNEVGRAVTEDDYTPNWRQVGENGVSAFAFGFINEALQNAALSLRDKVYIQEDVADAQKSYDVAMKVISDPNTTSEERKQAVQRAIDTTNYARQRMDDLGLPATRHEVSKAQEALADISEKLKPYLLEESAPPDTDMLQPPQTEWTDGTKSAMIGTEVALDFSAKGEDFVRQIVDNPKLFGTFDTPDDLKLTLENAGFEVKPLARGSLKGVRFEDGGGYKINFSDGGILQYHPEDHSHHGGAYYKISTGKGGTHRYDRNGNELVD